MSEKRAAGPHIRTVESGTRFHASTDWIMTILALGFAVAAAYKFGLPLVFDPNAPDFNPFGFVSVILCLVALRYAIPAARNTVRGRRFGQSLMEMEGQTVAPGETLRGVVRVPVDIAPRGDYELRLQCVQSQPTRSENLRDVIRSEQILRVPAQAVNPREGVPFSFLIPSDGMSTADSDLMRAGSVRWVLEAKAPLKGLNFYAIFGVEVRARR